MILLLYVVLSCVSFVCASLPSLNDTSIYTLDSSTCSPCNARTLWDILWSCGLTLFACTWTAVHPNIPGVDDGVVRNFFFRLGLMVMTLFVPEVTITWATMQFLSAWNAGKNFNRAFGWTLVHGFFAIMGGFVLYLDGEPRATLEPTELLRFVREGSVEMPTITEAEIKDRSKGDGISKCIAILQLVWFLIQLIARYAQGLPVTLLEIDTLGVTALACIVYGFWWKKPKDIGRPYIVHWKSEITAPTQYLLANKYRPGKRRSYVSPSMGIDSSVDYGPANFILITGCVSGMIFGGIHCLGWNYLFQAHKEQILWRVASTGMACSPLILPMSILLYWHLYLRFFTYYNICTCVPEFTITTSRHIRYSSLDQVYPTCNFVVSLQKYRNLPESRSTNQILNRPQFHLQPTWTSEQFR
ncbi:hypothetical protein EDD22DRAFT_819494 [Suillus occidentalis]|nr:hypothetical protein EDD22DRAFT_819494 [Suillus occidentalis]